MAQYSTKKSRLLLNNDRIYEVAMTAGGVSVYIPKGNLDTQSDALIALTWQEKTS